MPAASVSKNPGGQFGKIDHRQPALHSGYTATTMTAGLNTWILTPPATIDEEPAHYQGDSGRDRGKPPLPESALAKLWQRRAARQEWFRTSQGRRVRVLYPGRPGTAAGPDFRNALLHFEDEGVVQGDVEIHIRQQDWYAHGHRDDPNYNGVVLHAALDLHPGPTQRQSGGEVPVVSLASILPEGGGPAGDDREGDDREGDGEGDGSGGCQGQGGAVWGILEGLGYPRPDSPGEMAALLDRAGDERFLGKSRRFQKFLAEQTQEQVLYEGIMEALGYRHNQPPFVRLASLAPYAALERAVVKVPAKDLAATLESWLAQLSGLSQKRDARGVPLPRGSFGRPMDAGEWHCFRVRPANHPRRRIGGAARLLARCFDGTLEGGLVEGFARLVAEGSPRRLTDALTVTGGGVTCVGASRAREIAVNVALPLLHGLADTRGDVGEVDNCLGLYRKVGRLADNEVAREMAGLLSVAGLPLPKMSARRQQGLIHLQRVLAGAAG